MKSMIFIIKRGIHHECKITRKIWSTELWNAGKCWRGKIGAGEAAQALAVCTVAGGTIGSVFPGVGTAVGAILGAQYCTGAWAIIRAH